MTGYDEAEADVEFGGLEAEVGGWGSFWGNLKSVFKFVAEGAASSGALKLALNSQFPGLGDAAQKGLQLVTAGHAGHPKALAQLKAVADGAAAGDPAKAKAHDMLQVIAAALKEVIAEQATAQVGGKKKKKKGKKKFEFEKKKQQQQRPATTRDVQKAIQQTPSQARPQLVRSIQQAQAQGQYPVQPYAAPQPYGVQQPYGYGSPYTQQQWGMQPPAYPYGPQWASPTQYEQTVHYGGDADYELAQAFAGDESFPDEGIQGENAVAYQG